MEVTFHTIHKAFTQDGTSLQRFPFFSFLNDYNNNHFKHSLPSLFGLFTSFPFFQHILAIISNTATKEKRTHSSLFSSQIFLYSLLIFWMKGEWFCCWIDQNPSSHYRRPSQPLKFVKTAEMVGSFFFQIEKEDSKSVSSGPLCRSMIPKSRLWLV